MRPSPTILVLMNSTELLAQLTEELAQSVYMVVDVENVEQAQNYCHNHTPQLIIAEITNANQTHLTTCRRFKEEFPDIPVLMIVALDIAHQIKEVWAAGADEYLIYPFRPQKLTSYVENLVPTDRLHHHESAIFNNVSDAVIITDIDFRVQMWNASAERLYGWSAEEVIGKSLNDEILQTKYLKDSFLDVQTKLRANGYYESEIIQYKNTNAPIMIWSQLTVGSVDNRKSIIAVNREITEEKRLERSLLSVYRAYGVLSYVNKTLLHASSEAELLNDICQIVVHQGGYRLAWVGYARFDENKTVEPVSQAGYEDGYLQSLEITWADTPRGRGPTGTVIRTGEPYVARNIHSDPEFEPWRARALERGYASSLALPLRTEERTIGSLNVYSTEADAFDKEEVKLLLELADNLAYGIMSLRAREQRQLVEAALRESEERFRIVAENSPVNLTIIRISDETIIYANKTACQNLGYACAELINQKFATLFDDVNTYSQLLEQARQMNEVNDYLAQVHQADGTSIWLSFSTKMARFDNEEALYVSGINVTRRKEAENALQKLNEELEYRVQARTNDLIREHKQNEIILENVADAIVLTDIDGNILYVNPAWEKLNGYEFDEVLEKNISILQSTQMPSSIFENMWSTIKSGQVWEGRLVNRRKSGDLYQVQMTIAPVLDQDRKIKHFIGVQHDITLEQQLLMMKERFIADAAHDLGNPITILQTTLYLLKQSPDTFDKQLPRLEYAIDRLSDLVTDLLTLSRIDRQMIRLKLESGNINELIAKIVAGQSVVAYQKNQNLIFIPDAKLPPMVFDASEMERILVNLISNAINYTPEHGVIEITTAYQNDNITIVIKDNGIGIKSEELPHVFGRFYRSDEAKTISSGTGLGLSIVKELVEMHRGQIDVQSTYGAGSVFRLEFPIETTNIVAN